MKAYLPNLIAKKDVTYVTPTNAQQAHNANFASGSQNQKFVNTKRHTSSNSANFASQ